MILSLLIWYFIPPQLCSPHCTTCVYCLKHTCQIKEQLMHLIFNYCLPQPPRTMGKCQSGLSAVFAAPVGTTPPSSHACRGNANRNLNIEQELKRQLGCVELTHSPCLCKNGNFWHVTASVNVIRTKLFQIQNHPMSKWKISRDCADCSNLYFTQVKSII